MHSEARHLGVIGTHCVGDCAPTVAGDVLSRWSYDHCARHRHVQSSLLSGGASGAARGRTVLSWGLGAPRTRGSVGTAGNTLTAVAFKSTALDLTL